MNYGENFKTYRKKAGLSQKDAAEKLGINYYQLCNYEVNRSEPSLTTLVKMSDLYNTSLDCLLKIEKADEELKANVVKEILEDEGFINLLCSKIKNII